MSQANVDPALLVSRAKELESTYAGLQKTLDQVSKRQNSGNAGGSGAGRCVNLAELKQRVLKIREAHVQELSVLRAEAIAVDQQDRIIKTLKTGLEGLRKQVTNYMNKSAGSDELQALQQDYAKMRATVRERLLLLRSELQDMNANEEASLKSKQETGPVRITYWNGRGLAEPLRLMLAASDIKFENKFLTKPEELDALRASNQLYYQQVPLVEIDDMKLTQSAAALRYLARRAGMYGDSDKERFLIDLVCEGCRDARSPFGRHMAHGTTLDDCKNDFKEERFFGAWEKELNGNKNGLFVSKESVADVVVFEVLDYYKVVFGKDAFDALLTKYPNLAKLYSLVYKFGRIATYIETERSILPRDQYKAVVDATLRR